MPPLDRRPLHSPAGYSRSPHRTDVPVGLLRVIAIVVAIAGGAASLGVSLISADSTESRAYGLLH
jgi:hypothetical protein